MGGDYRRPPARNLTLALPGPSPIALPRPGPVRERGRTWLRPLNNRTTGVSDPQTPCTSKAPSPNRFGMKGPMSTTESVTVSSLEASVNFEGHSEFLSALHAREDLDLAWRASWKAKLDEARARSQDLDLY